MLNSWFEYQNDLNAMTDEEVTEETRRMEDQAVEAEAWLKAVAAWDAAGRPRHGTALTPHAPAQAEIDRLRERVAELEAAKWEVRHIDTMNDLAAMGVAKDVAEARALTAEAEVARLTAEREKDREALRLFVTYDQNDDAGGTGMMLAYDEAITAARARLEDTHD